MNVSILISTYGHTLWKHLAIKRAIPSADRQGSMEVLYRHDPGGTLASVRNGLAEKARGDWLVFLDADDELEPGYLSAMQACVSEKIVGPAQKAIWSGDRSGEMDQIRELLAPAVRYVMPASTPLGADFVSEPEIPNRDKPIEEMNHCVIGTAIPRWLFQKVGGFDPSLPAYEDWALVLACLRAGARIEYVPAAVYRAYVTEGGRNSQPPNVLGAAYDRIRAEHLEAAR